MDRRYLGAVALVAAVLLGGILLQYAVREQTPAAIAPPSLSPSPIASATAQHILPTLSPRPLASAELDCAVSWAEHYRSLQAMFDRADVVARGTVVARGSTLLYAFGAQGRFPRDARVTTLRVSVTFKGPPADEIRVIEDVCPAMGTDANDEWLVFGSEWDPRFGPDAPGPHYYALGGPQGQFRLRAGRVSGPFFAFQRVVRAYADAPAADLAATLRTMAPADVLARAVFERAGWTVVRTSRVAEVTLPATELCGAATFEHCADLSARVGLDLRSARGAEARLLHFVLEFPPAIGGGPRPPTGVAVAVDDRIAGAWVVSAVTRDVYAVNDRANVPVDR